MSNESATIVQRLWNYCNILRDDEIEKELGEALVRAEVLWQAVLKSAFEGMLV